MAQQQQSSPDQAGRQQQARQAAVGALVAAAMVNAWSLIDLSDLRASLPKYEAAVRAIVVKYGQVSAAVAGKYYQQARLDAGVTGVFRAPLAAPASTDQVHSSVGWATKGLWRSVPTISEAAERVRTAEPDVHDVSAVDERAQTLVADATSSLLDAEKSAKVLADGVAQKMVADTGRNTIIEAIEKDRYARGWARLARPQACYFCALLATRPPVYKEHSFDSSNARFHGDGTVKVHDHCGCIAVPVFADKYEPPAYTRQWQADYYAATKGVSGSKNMQLAWRRAYEGRTTQPELVPA